MLTNDEKIRIIEKYQCKFTTDDGDECESCHRELPEHSVIYCVPWSAPSVTEYDYYCEECMFRDPKEQSHD